MASPGTHFLIHELRSSADGKHSEIVDEVKNNEKLMSQLTKIYLERTSFSMKKLEKRMKRELEMNVEEAMEKGVVEKVYNGRFINV